MPLQPYQQRVIEEKRELDKRAKKLYAFFDTEIFKGLPVEEQELLGKQAELMTHYSFILERRIELFDSSEGG